MGKKIITFSGLDEFERDLNKLPELTLNAVRDFIHEVRDGWKLQAWITGSVDTGSYVGSISAREFLVESENDASVFLEFGSKKMKARHVAEKALDDLDRRERFFDIFDSWFDRQFEGAK